MRWNALRAQRCQLGLLTPRSQMRGIDDPITPCRDPKRSSGDTVTSRGPVLQIIDGGRMFGNGQYFSATVQCYYASEEQTEMVQAGTDLYVVEFKRGNTLEDEALVVPGKYLRFAGAAHVAEDPKYVRGVLTNRKRALWGERDSPDDDPDPIPIRAVGWGEETKLDKEEQAKCRAWRVESTRPRDKTPLLGGCSGRLFSFSEYANKRKRTYESSISGMSYVEQGHTVFPPGLEAEMDEFANLAEELYPANEGSIPAGLTPQVEQSSGSADGGMAPPPPPGGEVDSPSRASGQYDLFPDGDHDAHAAIAARHRQNASVGGGQPNQGANQPMITAGGASNVQGMGMQMPTAGGAGAPGGLGGPLDLNAGISPFVQQNGMPSVYDQAIAQKMLQRTNVLAQHGQNLGDQVQQVLQAGERGISWGYGSALRANNLAGPGSPGGAAYMGFGIESLPLPTAVDPTGGNDQFGGVVERKRHTFKKIYFESEYKLTHRAKPPENLVLRARDRLPDKPAPAQQSYNNFEEWLAAMESYLTKLVQKPPMCDQAYLFPEELENEILEDCLYEPHKETTEAARPSAQSKFARCMPLKMRQKVRGQRFQRRHRHTLTFLNLTYRLYEVYKGSFVRNREERDAFYDFKRNANEGDAEKLARYAEVSQAANQNLYPSLLDNRQDVWEELLRKVPDIDQDAIGSMMMHPEYRSPKVPFIENYMNFLEDRDEYLGFMNRRKSNPKVGALDEQVAAAKVDPKSRFKYNPRNPAGNFGDRSRMKGGAGGNKGGGKGGVRKGGGKNSNRAIRCKMCWGNHATESCTYKEPVCRICFKPDHFEVKCPNKPQTKVAAVMGTNEFSSKPLTERVAAVLGELSTSEKERVMLVTIDEDDTERKYVIQDRCIEGNSERVYCTEVNDDYAYQCEIVLGVQGDEEEDWEEEAAAGRYSASSGSASATGGDDDGAASEVSEGVALAREPVTRSVMTTEDLSFFDFALNKNGYVSGKSATPEDGGELCAFEVHQEAMKLLNAHPAAAVPSTPEKARDEGTEGVLFTTETDEIQLDSGYTNKVYVDTNTCQTNRRLGEKNGLEVPYHPVNEMSGGIGNSKQKILAKCTLPFRMEREDGSVYAYGFEEVTETPEGPNLGGLTLQKKTFCSTICDVGEPNYIRGHDGTCIVNFEGKRQIFHKIFSMNERDYERLRQIQQNNKRSDWCRPVFEVPLDPVKVARKKPEFPYDPRPISFYDEISAAEQLKEEEQVMFTHQDGEGLGMLKFQQKELTAETRCDWPMTLLEDDVDKRQEKSSQEKHTKLEVGAGQRSDVPRAFHTPPQTSRGLEQIMGPVPFGLAEAGALRAEKAEEVFPAAASGDQPDSHWEVTTAQLRREGDVGGYAVFRMTDFGLEVTPAIPTWLKNRVRLRRVTDVLRQRPACPDLSSDWMKRANQIEQKISDGKLAYVTIDYYFHLPQTIPKRAPTWMSSKEEEDYQLRMTDRKRGRLSIEQHKASIPVEHKTLYKNIGAGIMKSAVHNAPTADKFLKQPGKLEDVRIFTCRDLVDVPPVIRETAKVFRVEERDDLGVGLLDVQSSHNWMWRPKLTEKVVETGFTDSFVNRVTDEQLKPITQHLRGGKRVILQCSSGVGLSVAIAERLRTSVYGKNGKVYHASAPIELFIHDLSLTPGGVAIRYTEDERVRVDTVLSPTRSMTADERKKVRLIQEILFLHGKLQSEKRCWEQAKSRLKDISEKALRQLLKVARRDSVARLNLALGVRRKNITSLTNYEALRSGGVTFIDATFFTEFGFIYSAIGGMSGADGRGRHSVSGLKWKLEPFLQKSGLDAEEQERIRQGIMFNMQDGFSTRLLRGKASPSVEDVARAVRRFLSLLIVRRRIYGDAGLENLGLKDWKALADSGRTIQILPSGKAVYKLERRFLSVKTAHNRMRRLPEFHGMGLQYLLDEIDEMMDHLSTVRLQGRTPAQAFWGLEESRPEMLTHPDDVAVERHSWGDINIHRLTEGRLRITSELLEMQNGPDFVAGVKRIVANCLSQCREEADEDSWEVGDELNYYNQKNKTHKRVRLLQKLPDQGAGGYTYVCQADRGTITAKKENLCGGFDLDHFFNLPGELQPVTSADYRRGGRLYKAQKTWAENNLLDVDLELQVPTNAFSHESGPFYSFSPPRKGTKRKSKTEPLVEESEDSVEVEVSDEDPELPPVDELMQAPAPAGEMDTDPDFAPGNAEADGVQQEDGDPMDVGFLVELGGEFRDVLDEDPLCRNSCFVRVDADEPGAEEEVAFTTSSDTWCEDETTLTRFHGEARQARFTPTKVSGVVGDVASKLEDHRITTCQFVDGKPRTEIADQWRIGTEPSPTAHKAMPDQRKWTGKTVFFKRLGSIGEKLLSDIPEAVAAAAGKPEDDEGGDDLDGPRTLAEFIRNPKREDRRTINKLLLHEKEGPLKEDSMLWQMIVERTFEKQDGAQFCPTGIEIIRGWKDEQRELSDPATQKEVLLSWGRGKVRVVKNKAEFVQAGGETTVRLVLCSLSPHESRPDLGLLSVLDPQVAEHAEVVEKLHGALKWADSDHSFIYDGQGLASPDLLTKGHLTEWGKLLDNNLVEKWTEGVPCSDEGILTSRAIADLKMVTPWHFKVAVRLVPGGHKSTVSATAESPTLSELELRMIISSLRRVRGKRILRSGDVPRAFLKNLRFKASNRPSPCVFRRGSSFVGVHVDDLLFCGDEEGFQYLASELRKRFQLEKWTDAVDGLAFTGIQVHFDEKAETVNLSMRQKIEELKPGEVPDDLERPLNEEEVSCLKGKRGSLLFVGRAHPEVTLPTRTLAIGSDQEKDGRWTKSQNGIIARAKMESNGTTIDLSYRDEMLIMFPDASFQQPTSDEAENAGAAAEEQETRLVNLNTHFGGGQVRGRDIAAWRREKQNNVYIGRGSKWGNPYRAPRDGNRDEVIRKYAEHFERSGLKEKVEELRGKSLGCFCCPFPCHGDVILEALAEKEEELICAAAEADAEEQALEEKRNFARDYGVEFLYDVESSEMVLGATEKSETSRRKRKRFAAVEMPSTDPDPTSRKAKQLRGQLGYVFLSVSRDDWLEYERRQVAVKRVDTIREYNELEVVRIRCSYLNGDTMFMAGVSPSSYDVELHSLGEAVPVLEMTMHKLRNWGMRVPGVVLSDSRSAVLRVVSKSVISFSDAGVFKILARVKSAYSRSEWELGSVTDKVNPGDNFTKIATGNKIVQLSEILGGVLNLPLGTGRGYKCINAEAGIPNGGFTWMQLEGEN
eukprot:g3150.t1